MTSSSPSGSLPREDTSRAGKQNIKRVLNMRLLLGTLIAVVVLGPAAYAWRTYQVSRTSKSFLGQAAKLEEAEDWEKAAEYLHRYLRLHSDDTEVRVRLAETYGNSAQDPQRKVRAVSLYNEALGIAPAEKRHSLRCRLVELQLELAPLVGDPKRYVSAEIEAQKLVDENANDPEGNRLLALALHGQFRSGALAARFRGQPAGDVLKRVMKLNPGDIELSVALAGLYRDGQEFFSNKDQDQFPSADVQQKLRTAELRQMPLSAEELEQLLGGDNEEDQKLNPLAEADRVMDEMVKTNADSVDAYLTRYGYRTRYELPSTKEDLDAALKYGPDNLTVLLLAADYALTKEDDPDTARRHYEHAIEVDRSTEQAYVSLGVICLRQGDAELAIQTWRDGLDACDEDSITLNSHLADLLMNQGTKEKLDQAGEHLDNLDQAINKLNRRLTRAGRLSLRYTRDLLRGRWHLGRGEHVKAIPLLKAVTTSDAVSSQEIAQVVTAWRSLGQAYEALGQWDRAAMAYEEALALQPQNVQLHLLAASASANVGQIDTAIRCYRQALSLEDNPEIWLALAQARYRRQTGLPEDDRNWSLFNTALANAKKPQSEKPLTNEWQLKLLEANYRIAAAKEEERSDAAQLAKILLQEAEKEHPDSAALYQSLVFAYEQLGFAEDADRALGKVDQLAQNSVLPGIIRAQLYVRRGDSEALESEIDGLQEELQPIQKELAELQKKLKTVPANTPHAAGLEVREDELNREIAPLKVQISTLELGLAQINLGRAQGAEQRVEQIDKLRQLLERLHADDPSNMARARQLAELAFEKLALIPYMEVSDDKKNSKKESCLEDMERWEKTLRELEGVDGYYWRYYRARRLLVQAPTTDDPEFIEADELRARLQSLRPAWHQTHALTGSVAYLKGRVDQAIKAYQEAIRLGERRFFVYERLIYLLRSTLRFEEADRYFSQLPERVTETPNLSAMEISIAANLGQTDRAIEAASRRVDRRPDDPISRLWLADLLTLNKQTTEAEAEFEEAIRLSPTEIQPYDALFRFYLRIRRFESARETLERIENTANLPESERLPEEQRVFALARGYEVLGDMEKAAESYAKVEEAAPENLEVRNRLAAFLSRSDPEKAAGIYRNILEASPDYTTARLALAAILAARGGQEDWQEIDKLLSNPKDGHAVSNLDKHAQAVLLHRSGDAENRDRARALLEEIVADPENAIDASYLLLAQIYEEDAAAYQRDAQEYADLIQKSRQLYTKLVVRNKPEAAHLVQYINMLLRHNLDDAAAKWVTKLEEVDPHTLAALLHSRRGAENRKQAREILEELVADSSKTSDASYLLLAQIYEQDAASYQLEADRYVELEESNKLDKLDPNDRNDLESSHEQYTDLIAKSRQQYTTLVSRDHPDAAHMGAFIDMLLRQDMADEAAEWSAKLLEIAPRSLTAIARHARCLNAQGKTSEIKTFLEQLAADLIKNVNKEQEAQLCLNIGNIYSLVKQHKEAERWYRRLGELTPERYEVLALSLANQDRVKDAIIVCTEAAKSDDSSKPVRLMASILVSKKVSAEDFQTVEPYIEKALQQHGDDPDLLYGLSNVRIVQNRNHEAVGLLEKLLELQPENYLAMNNLATILAEQPDRRNDAIQHIDKAIEVAGPLKALLDTKGTILVLDGRPKDALPVLEEAASGSNDPRFYFHLAVAYYRLDQTEKARAAFEAAKDGKLTDQILTTSDQKFRSELESALGPQG